MKKSLPVISQDLVDAIFDGDKDRVVELVEGGASVRAVNSDGCDAGLLAAVAGNIEIYDYLASQPKFKKKSVDKFGNDAAILAATFGHMKMYDHLIQKYSFDVNAVSKNGNNALIMAVENNVDVESIKHLISSHPINLNHLNKDGKRADDLAVLRGRGDAGVLMETIGQQSALDISLIDALKDFDLFKNLCEQGAQPKRMKFGDEDLASFAVARGNADAYKLLVEEYRHEVKKLHLLRASAKGHEDVVKYIVEEHHQRFTALDLEEARSVSSGNQVISDVLSVARKSRVKLDDVVTCISPDKQSKNLWRKSDDSVIYYSFDSPIFNPTLKRFTEEEKNFFREVIARNKDLIKVRIEEISLVGEESGLKALLASPKNTIMIATAESIPSSVGKEMGRTRSFDANDHSGVAHKKVTLSPGFLGEGMSREYAAYTFIHEFFGHAIGCLEHPNQYDEREKGVFCKEDIFADMTVMSYRNADEMLCRANQKLDKKECDKTWPQTLTEADLKAISQNGIFAKNPFEDKPRDEFFMRMDDPTKGIDLDFSNKLIEERNHQKAALADSSSATLFGVLAARAIKRLVGGFVNSKGNGK